MAKQPHNQPRKPAHSPLRRRPADPHRRCAGTARAGRPAAPDFTVADAFVWQPAGRKLIPVPKVNRVEMSLLKGIDTVRDILVENTERFAKGLPANNALLWGARGMGKSSLVKATHAAINAVAGQERRHAEARRNSSRGYRKPARPDGDGARRAEPPLHRVLRRPFVRYRRHLVQIS